MTRPALLAELHAVQRAAAQAFEKADEALRSGDWSTRRQLLNRGHARLERVREIATELRILDAESQTTLQLPPAA